MHLIRKLETDYIHYIKNKTKNANLDNISRTKAYQNFYRLFPEIKWSFLASMVSRNAGWNMTDMKTETYKEFLSPRVRKQLFSTYERANWLIFSDAYPQLLLYQLSDTINKPLFHLLEDFSVSKFMQREWCHFWREKDKDRLLTALIINEQNVIQVPVTKHPFYKYHVFMNWPYLLQDFFKMSAVLFPSRKGYVYAIDVHDFSNVTNRINLGKRLASTLFHPMLYQHFYDFALHTEHTGSRSDYEQYIVDDSYSTSNSPSLRRVFPIIDHQDTFRMDWYLERGIKKKWWKTEDISDNQWNSYNKKKKLIETFIHMKNYIM